MHRKHQHERCERLRWRRRPPGRVAGAADLPLCHRHLPRCCLLSGACWCISRLTAESSPRLAQFVDELVREDLGPSRLLNLHLQAFVEVPRRAVFERDDRELELLDLRELRRPQQDPESAYREREAEREVERLACWKAAREHLC
ncbi:hypothetical protein PybrP1_012745 [[Pythium] brassicae (nom. inval.)]|nr:hypothetical protein PybrP1_012745 [[Pythium] brassicae (nom. inval.)]